LLTPFLRGFPVQVYGSPRDFLVQAPLDAHCSLQDWMCYLTKQIVAGVYGSDSADRSLWQYDRSRHLTRDPGRYSQSPYIPVERYLEQGQEPLHGHLPGDANSRLRAAVTVLSMNERPVH